MSSTASKPLADITVTRNLRELIDKVGKSAPGASFALELDHDGMNEFVRTLMHDPAIWEQVPVDVRTQLTPLVFQTLRDFQNKQLPPKTPLIDGILYKRDRISLTGRRRHGKTTLISNIALAGALGHTEYLGFKIPQPFNSIVFYLEDDDRELQDKFHKMLKGKSQPTSFHLYTRSDFLKWKIRVGFNVRFKNEVKRLCKNAHPDLIIFDNLAHLTGGDYNNPTLIHEVMEFAFELAEEFDAAVLVAAHPRKGAKVNPSDKLSLKNDPEAFCEECMGSSHFINSTGSLWGIERDTKTNLSHIFLGAQRISSSYGQVTLAENDKFDWFKLVTDYDACVELVMNTDQRREAWAALPDLIGTYNGAFKLLSTPDPNTRKKIMGSKTTFQTFWDELKRQKLIVEEPAGSSKFEKRRLNMLGGQLVVTGKP